MARANTIQTNFTAGEISPQMYGRVDVQKYFNGARKLRNMIVMPQGGAFRRPGSEFINSTKNLTGRAVVRRFIFNETQAFMLELGQQYIRIYYDGGIVLDSGSPVEIATPYLEADLATLRFTQSGDILYITHNSYIPATLIRNSNISWTYAPFTTFDGPYLSQVFVTQQGDPQLTLTVINDTALATASSAIFSAGTSHAITAIVSTAPNTWPVPVKITAASHGLTTGDSVVISGVSQHPGSGFNAGTIPNGQYVATVIDSSHFTLNNSVFPVRALASGADITYTDTVLDFAGATCAKPGGTATYVEYRDGNKYKLFQILFQLTTTTAQVQVVDYSLDYDTGIKITFSGGTVTASQPVFTNNDIGKVIRITNGVWYNITAFTDSENVTGTVVATLAPTLPDYVLLGKRQITVAVTSDVAYFAATDVSRQIRFEFSGQSTWGTISSFTNSQHIQVNLNLPVPLDPTGPRAVPVSATSALRLSGNGVCSSWRIGAWSPTSGYPAVCAFHQQRIGFARSTVEPQTLWLGVIADFGNFQPNSPDDASVSDTDAITITLASVEIDPIQWMSSGAVLLVGTLGAEWQIKPSAITQAITPTNIGAYPQTSFGSASFDESHRVGSQILFVQRGARKLREMSYDFSLDAFVSKDISIISEHLMREHGGVTSVAIQTKPINIVWMTTVDGFLIGITYERDQDVVAWHLHDLGGAVDYVDCVPSVDGSEDELYAVVRRVFDTGNPSVLVRNIERVCGWQKASVTTLNDTNYLDGSLSFDHGSADDLGLLAGTTTTPRQVSMTVDGVDVGAIVINTGGLTPDQFWVGYHGRYVHIGIENDCVVGILDPEGGSQAGTSQAKKKRVTLTDARLFKSRPFKIASAITQTDATQALSAVTDPQVSDRKDCYPPIVVNAARLQSDALNTPYPIPTATDTSLITGDIRFSVDDAFDCGGRFELVQDKAYPFNLLMLAHKLNTNE